MHFRVSLTLLFSLCNIVCDYYVTHLSQLFLIVCSTISFYSVGFFNFRDDDFVDYPSLRLPGTCTTHGANASQHIQTLKGGKIFHYDHPHASRRFFQFLIFIFIKKQKKRWLAPIDRQSIINKCISSKYYVIKQLLTKRLRSYLMSLCIGFILLYQTINIQIRTHSNTRTFQYLSTHTFGHAHISIFDSQHSTRARFDIETHIRTRPHNQIPN